MSRGAVNFSKNFSKNFKSHFPSPPSEKVFKKERTPYWKKFCFSCIIRFRVFCVFLRILGAGTMEDSKDLRIAVVGGGISGLSAALYCQEHFPDGHGSVSVFEKRERLGGVLNTELRDGFEIEQSADNFITTVPYGLDLCRRLGLESDIVTTTPRNRQTFILWKDRLHKLPDGFMMMAPSKWWPMAVTRLLSPFGKLRAAMEYFIPAKKGDEDESMESFAVRRLGREVFDRLIEPLVSGVYAADMTRLSLLATLPRFREMEKKHGSLIRAMRKNCAEMKKKARQEKKKNGTASQNADTRQSGPRYNLFVTVKGGLGRITSEIEKRLDPQTVYCRTEVTQMARTESGKWSLTWRSLENGRTESAEFDAVILAGESHNIAKLLGSAQIARPAELLAGIEHTGTVILTAAFRREDIGHPLDGMGAVVPAKEKNPILALSFSSEKYPHRAPEGTVLLRIFSGGSRDPEIVDMPEDEVRDLLLEKMANCLKIQGSPLMTSVSRWPNTMPQFHLGHLERIADLEKEMEAYPTLGVAGNSLTGVGIPHCIHSGEEAARKVLAALEQ